MTESWLSAADVCTLTLKGMHQHQLRKLSVRSSLYVWKHVKNTKILWRGRKKTDSQRTLYYLKHIDQIFWSCDALAWCVLSLQRRDPEEDESRYGKWMNVLQYICSILWNIMISTVTELTTSLTVNCKLSSSVVNSTWISGHLSYRLRAEKGDIFH